MSKLAYPLRLTPRGTLATVEQDSWDDVAKCVDVLLHTPVGTRPLAPDVGITDPTFSSGMTSVTADELMRDEPRAVVEISTDGADGIPADGHQAVRVTVSLAEDSDDEDDLQ